MTEGSGNKEMVRIIAEQLFEIWKSEQAREAKESRRWWQGNIGGWLAAAVTLVGVIIAGRITQKGADIISALVCVAVSAAILFGLIYLAINAIRNDARTDLLADQAEERRIALEEQRVREGAAAAARAAELATGAATDAKQQKEITDATQDLPDTRPSDRARRRVCVELQQQDRAAGRPARTC